MTLPEPPETPSKGRWVHWVWRNDLVFYATSMFVLACAKAWVPGADAWHMWVLVGYVVCYTVTVQAASNRHVAGLCPWCFAEFPTDPGKAASGKYLLLLHTVHLMSDFAVQVRRLVRSVVAAALIVFTVVLMTVPILAWTFVPEPWGTALAWVWLVPVISSASIHARFAAWCPWCKNNGGGGDGEQVPDPDPAPGRHLHA